QEGTIVIAAVRQESVGEKRVLEATLLAEYFADHGIRTVDLTKENVVEGRLRSKPLRKDIRDWIGNEVKFVDVVGQPNRRAWRLGKEVWVNLGNPAMRRVYESLQSVSFERARLARILIDILSFQLDEAIRDILRLLESREAFPRQGGDGRRNKIIL